MNSEMITGSWNQIKGGIKEAFGKLTDDDMLQLEGSLDRATGLLQERYGYSKERAQQEWDTFASQYNRAARSVADNTDSYLRNASNNASNKVDEMVNRGSEAVKNAAESVKDAVDSAKKKMQS